MSDSMSQHCPNCEAQAAENERLQWQPIDTAPKDGTTILGWECDEILLVAYCVDDKWIWMNFMSDHTSWSPNPTHWMPLPAPPASGPTLRGRGS
jgi:hypothetical protein